ncbi:ATP-binding protein [Streptomyces sp. NRRL S-118]|uniref:sensor histidine kinase n=1 Tax=Streptomyces sp. NRRL S-118 TaxID=1463881 RepID=UPI0006933008|nr:ATP-binding protein [Streptomyces sp. NRRL S-118]
MPTSRTAPGGAAAPGVSPPGTPAIRGRRAHAGPPGPGDHRVPHTAARRPAGARGRPRPRTVRARIISLLMVPVVSLLALWGFATVTTAQDVTRLREARHVDDRVRQPVATAAAALQAERSAAVRQAAAPGSGHATGLQRLARRTDAAVATLRLDDRHTVADTGDLPADVAARVRKFVDRAEGLAALRTAVIDGGAGGDTVYTRYTAAISAAFDVQGALTGMPEVPQGSRARVLLELARAGEMLSREDALLTSARLNGEFPAPRHRTFTGTVETRRTLLASASADLPAPQRDGWRRPGVQRPHRQLVAAEDAVVAAAPGRKAAAAVPAAAWDGAHGAVRTALAALESDARSTAADDTDPLTGGILTPAGAAVLLGLAAVAASLVISVRIGRALVVELVTLRNTALEIARRKLPHAMGRLRAGEELDIRTEAPPGPPAQDEIGQVGEALGTVHRAALGAAAERAELASGISGVFVNLARRSQVLVHRQLTLLDSMERRVDDPAELGDLFRLDHLTTRMRRHAESLIILSGAAPGRAWRTPVPLTDVVRAAVSEIEDYARVEVRHLPETAVDGTAVADLTHLLAELVENATQFSPPHTKVRVTGEPVGNGYALEIEDRGLGMGRQALAEANHRIRQSEALDLFDSDRLGLFVVSRLSARHDIQVHLRPSPYGGTTAVVLLPTDLLRTALPADVAGRATTVPAPPSAAHSRPPRVPVPTPTGTAPTGTASADHQPHEPPPARVTALPVPGRPPGPPSRPSPPRPGRPDDPVVDGAGGRSGEHDARNPTEHGRSGEYDVSSRAGRGPHDPRGDMVDDRGGLPRRVRQAGLAPQLREAPPPRSEPDPATGGNDTTRTADPTGTPLTTRTPEQVRDRMTAYRDGWVRGGAAGEGDRR